MNILTNYLHYLQEIKRPAVLYHAAEKLTKTLKPRKTTLYLASKSHGRDALFASHNKLYAFGLERSNLMVPYKHTEAEVNSWEHACWLDPQPPKLIVHYWNYIPKKPVYLYHVDSKGFKPFIAKTRNTTTHHWYIEKEIIPLKVDVIQPRDIENIAWMRATKKDWERKKKRYSEMGAYKK